MDALVVCDVRDFGHIDPRGQLIAGSGELEVVLVGGVSKSTLSTLLTGLRLRELSLRVVRRDLPRYPAL